MLTILSMVCILGMACFVGLVLLFLWDIPLSDLHFGDLNSFRCSLSVFPQRDPDCYLKRTQGHMFSTVVVQLSHYTSGMSTRNLSQCFFVHFSLMRLWRLVLCCSFLVPLFSTIPMTHGLTGMLHCRLMCFRRKREHVLCINARWESLALCVPSRAWGRKFLAFLLVNPGRD